MCKIPGICSVAIHPQYDEDGFFANMGCYPSKRERIDVINGEILEFGIAIRNLKRGIEEAKDGIAFYVMEIEDLEKEKLDLWEKILEEEEQKAKKQKEEEKETNEG